MTGWLGLDGKGSHHVVVFVFDDVAVVDVSLRRGDSRGKVEFGADGCQVAGVDFDCDLEASFGRVGREHWAGRERGRVDSGGDAVWAFVGFLVGLGVERCPSDNLEGDEMGSASGGCPRSG